MVLTLGIEQDRHLFSNTQSLTKHQKRCSIFCMDKIINVVFYQTHQGKESVKDWLMSLAIDDRKAIGQKIKTVEFGWPLGMPLVRKLSKGLWEVRIEISNGIARVIFSLVNNQMVLLHGFIKKTQKTPKNDLELALKRMRDI